MGTNRARTRRTIQADAARLRAALAECITEDGARALQYQADPLTWARRLRAINDTARATLAAPAVMPAPKVKP